MMAAAFDAGINFFDNAEVYADGQSETVINYIVSTKFFWGLHKDGPTANKKDTFNRKYLTQAIDASLKRLGLDFIDLAYCHRPDPHTPNEETVWAMSDMIARGKALYWGTSEWSAHPARRSGQRTGVQSESIVHCMGGEKSTLEHGHHWSVKDGAIDRKPGRSRNHSQAHAGRDGTHG
jgi:aryl-alcohol dehydrogenase-like predicted oxidoreductase